MNIKRIENIPNSFYTQLAKIWFKDDWGNEEITDTHNLKKFFQDITIGFLYGDDSIIYQERSGNVLTLMQDFELIPYHWTIEDVRRNGRKMAVAEFQNAVNSPTVQNAFRELTNAIRKFRLNEKIFFDTTQRDLIEKYKTEKFYN